MIGGLLLNLVIIAPLFLTITTANAVLIAVVLGISIHGGAAYYAMLASFTSRAFPANVRFTGVAAFYGAIAVAALLGVWGLHAKMSARDAERTGNRTDDGAADGTTDHSAAHV